MQIKNAYWCSFLSSDGCEIDIDDDSDYSISEIMVEGIVYMKSKSFKAENEKPKIIKKNTPIQGSKLLEKSKGLDIYLYPKLNLIKNKIKKQ